MVTPAVFLFVGDDIYSKEEAIKKLKASLLTESSKEFDYKVFYGQEAVSNEIFEYLTTVPFLAQKRLVVVRDFEKSPADFKTNLINYLKKPSKSACLVLDIKDDMPDYGMEPYVSVQRFGCPADAELTPWIKKRLSDKGKSIDADAVRELKELQGSDLMMLSQELEKLALFTGEREDVEASDVEAVVGKGLAVSAFELTSAVERNSITDALRICSELMMTGKRHQEIIGLLCWHMTRLLRAKILHDKGESEMSIVNILRIGRRYSEEFFRQVRSLEISRIRAKIGILLGADADIKRTRFDPTLILEFSIIRLCLS